MTLEMILSRFTCEARLADLKKDQDADGERQRERDRAKKQKQEDQRERIEQRLRELAALERRINRIKPLKGHS